METQPLGPAEGDLLATYVAKSEDKNAANQVVFERLPSIAPTVCEARLGQLHVLVHAPCALTVLCNPNSKLTCQGPPVHAKDEAKKEGGCETNGAKEKDAKVEAEIPKAVAELPCMSAAEQKAAADAANGGRGRGRGKGRGKGRGSGGKGCGRGKKRVEKEDDDDDEVEEAENQEGEEEEQGGDDDDDDGDEPHPDARSSWEKCPGSKKRKASTDAPASRIRQKSQPSKPAATAKAKAKAAAKAKAKAKAKVKAAATKAKGKASVKAPSKENEGDEEQDQEEDLQEGPKEEEEGNDETISAEKIPSKGKAKAKAKPSPKASTAKASTAKAKAKAAAKAKRDPNTKAKKPCQPGARALRVTTLGLQFCEISIEDWGCAQDFKCNRAMIKGWSRPDAHMSHCQAYSCQVAPILMGKRLEVWAIRASLSGRGAPSVCLLWVESLTLQGKGLRG